MARLASDLILSLIDRVSGPARKAERSLDRLQRQTRRSSELTARDVAMMGRAQSMMLASVAGVATPAAVALGARAVATAAANFESSLTEIEKKAGTTAAQTRRLGEEIKALATSGELAMSIDEIAAAYERGAAAGIPLAELREFARLSAMAADAFEMSASDVGDAAAGFNKVLGVPMRDMERLFDLINGLADAGIADESEIVAFVDKAGAMAKTFGLSVEQTAALGAALANLKVPANQAATAVNSILTKLLAPDALSERGRESFEELVGDAEAFAKMIEEDADGALVALIKKLKTLDKAARTEIIAELFGMEHLDVVSQLVAGSDELIRNLEYVSGSDWLGSLGSSYEKKLDEFWSQWQLLKNEFGKLMIDVGTSGMPAAKAGLERLRELVDDIGEGLKSFEATIDTTELDAALVAVGDLSAAIGDLMNMGGEGTVVGRFFSGLASDINVLTNAVNRAEDVLQTFGLVKPDDDSKATVARRREKFQRDMFGERQLDYSAFVDMRGEAEGLRKRIDAINAEGGHPAAIKTLEAKIRLLEHRTETNAEKLRTGAAGLTVRRPVYETSRGTVTPRTPKLPARTTGGVPIPAPRPDIEGPIEVEGVKAALKAEEIGHRISQAFNVTAAPTIDTTSIRQAKREADALEAALRRINTLSDDANASVKRSRIDFDGVHADTTHPGY